MKNFFYKDKISILPKKTIPKNNSKELTVLELLKKSEEKSSKHFSVHAKLNTGELLIATIKNDTNFLIQSFSSSGILLPYVRLEGSFQKDNSFYLRLISNEECLSLNVKKNRHNGVGIFLVKLLLTFISDYNMHVGESERINFIIGSIVPLGSTDINYLRAFYRKIDGLTDFGNTIRIEMNYEEHERNSLLYAIVATK